MGSTNGKSRSKHKLPRLSRPRAEKEMAEMARLNFVAEHYFEQGETQQQIAAQLGISQQTVSRILAKMRQAAREACLLSAAEATVNELIKLEVQERRYVQAYEKSKEPVEQITDFGDVDANCQVRVKRSIRTRMFKHPDPRFLNGITAVIDRRMKLLGIGQGDSNDPRPPTPNPYDSMSHDQKVAAAVDFIVALAAQADALGLEAVPVDGAATLPQTPGTTATG